MEEFSYIIKKVFAINLADSSLPKWLLMLITKSLISLHIHDSQSENLWQ